MRMLSSGITAILLAAGVAVAQPQENDLLQRAAVIKPRPEEVRWQKVPWVVDLVEGQRLAKAEKRPIFLWATVGTLERC
jgi:hypothetical protein